MRRSTPRLLHSLIAAVLCAGLAAPATAAAIRSGFDSQTLGRTDDGSTSASIGFDIDFFGTTYDSLFINNNGNATFGSALSNYTPLSLDTLSVPILAPYFADVDTRSAANGALAVTYGAGTVGAYTAFGINWVNVGYYNQNTDLLNSFQLVLIQRLDRGVGEFDVEFNYDQIQWETGDFSGGSGGLGGNSARVGYGDGAGFGFELDGSASNGAFLDGGPSATALVQNEMNTGTAGSFLFTSAGGTMVPEPGTGSLVALGLAGLAFVGRRRR